MPVNFPLKMVKEVNNIVCVTQYKYMGTLRIIVIVLTILYHQYFQLSPDGTSSQHRAREIDVSILPGNLVDIEYLPFLTL